MGCYEEALADFERAVELAPGCARAIVLRGSAYRKMGRYRDALSNFDRVIELKPDDAWTIAQRGETYLQMGCYEEALSDFNRAIELNPDCTWVIILRGETYRQMECYEEALANFDRAIELDPDDVWTIVRRGETYRQMSCYEEALSDFNRAIELDPDCAWPIILRGKTYRDMCRSREALTDFDRAIKLKVPWRVRFRRKLPKLFAGKVSRRQRLLPNDVWAIVLRGETYRQTGHYEESLADLDWAIKLEPYSAWTIAHRGETYRLMKRYEEALADFDQAVELKPDYGWVIAHRGEVYRQMGFEKALADFDRPIELNPECFWAIVRRGETYLQMGCYEEALADFDRAIELKPYDAWTIALRGDTCRKMGCYEEALANRNQAVELKSEGGPWRVTPDGDILQISYGSGIDFPQYGALHRRSSYFRLVCGPASVWGTSVILLPAFWRGERLYQGAPVEATCHVEGPDLVLSIAGTIAGLRVSSKVWLSPPTEDGIAAQVTTEVEGNVPLDRRPGEAFKPVMLSSMHISPTAWDTQAAYAGCRTFPIPERDWIVQPPVVARIFGLQGGASDWKADAPTIEIVLDRQMQITGWVTPSKDRDDDNVGFWTASDEVLPSWSYKIIALPMPNACSHRISAAAKVTR